MDLNLRREGEVVSTYQNMGRTSLLNSRTTVSYYKLRYWLLYYGIFDTHV